MEGKEGYIYYDPDNKTRSTFFKGLLFQMGLETTAVKNTFKEL